MSTLLKKEAFGTRGKAPYRLLELSFDEELDGNLVPIFFRICDQTTLTWNGQNWARLPWEIKGEGTGTDGEVARPKLTIPNENRQFSWYAERGFLEGSIVNIYQVHPDEVHTNQYIFKTYILTKIMADNEVQVSFELRSPSDGPNFKLPARRFLPPEFQSVRR